MDDLQGSRITKACQGLPTFSDQWALISIKDGVFYLVIKNFRNTFFFSSEKEKANNEKQ